AAEGGNVALVRFLIDKGLPLEGHWAPRSPVLRREGHITALMSAAINGHADVVRLLLGAGADRNAKFSGQTALQMTKDQADLARIGGAVATEQKCRAAMAVLAEKSATAARPAQAPDDSRAVAAFAANAQKPAYQQIRELLTERCGQGRSWQPLPDHGIAA